MKCLTMQNENQEAASRGHRGPQASQISCASKFADQSISTIGEDLSAFIHHHSKVDFALTYSGGART